MSTIFDVPCPDCGRSMVVEATGNMQCRTCHRVYRARMGHLFAVAEPARAGMGEKSAARPPARPNPARS
jgi:tRNA(Ile2) C34 agmatinyltransferase TiaS